SRPTRSGRPSLLVSAKLIAVKMFQPEPNPTPGANVSLPVAWYTTADPSDNRPIRSGRPSLFRSANPIHVKMFQPEPIPTALSKASGPVPCQTSTVPSDCRPIRSLLLPEYVYVVVR